MNISAISTPSGIGGIAVLRLSGPEVIDITARVFRPFKSAHSLGDRPSHTLTFGQLVNERDEVIDEVVVSLYRAPHSFTGENVVEISCHGSQYVQQTVLQLLLTNGCRLAEPGEFTRRAFANGRMDLSQAEAVADLIAANNAAAHRLAINQMKGTFSRRLAELRAQLLNLSALLELELDFSEEDVEFADRSRLSALANEIHEAVSSLAQSFQTGNVIKNGIPVTIIGETNAGKSTLLNLLLGDDKAIVSDIHGTTRDVVEDTSILGGTLLRFIDTAGIRDTQDAIEQLGIERTYQRLRQANIVLWMIDGTRLGDEALSEQLITDVREMIVRIAPHFQSHQQLSIIINKIDLVAPAVLQHNLHIFCQAIDQSLGAQPHCYLTLSAKTQEGIEALRQHLIETTTLPQIHEGDVIVTNIRHYQALCSADEAIVRVMDGLSAGLSGDFIAQDLRECNHFLGSIVGQVSDDEILGAIFSRFCIGK